jgi:DNA-binding MarR family transcriptional regulator
VSAEGAADDADLAILVAAAMHAVSARLRSAMDERGIERMRPSYGYVIRAVAAEEPSVNRMAQLLGVTKQSASRLVDDMERDGFVERVENPDDRRVRRLRLTEQGRAVRSTALATSAAMEAELRRELGADVDAARRTLVALVAASGALEDLAAGRARPAW